MIDLWNKLKCTAKPIVMYGMGDGAEKILKVFARYGIQLRAVFASDEFVRGHSFHGFKVMKFAEICDMFDDFIIIVSFATALPNVLKRIYALAERYELYIPDVPVVGEELFNMEFHQLHIDKINQARELLYDNESKAVYDNIINYKLSGEIQYLINSQSEVHDILRPEKYTSYADLGAYNGDTIRTLMNDAPILKDVYAFEPDTRNFKKLCDIKTINTYNLAAWNEKAILTFDRRGGRNSRIGRGSHQVQADSLDNILQGKSVDYIKYDVEGAEYEALTGSSATIKKYSPDLTVSLYHRSGDIFNLVLYVHELNPVYKLYLRRYPYIPAWDLNLYSVI